MRQIFKNKGFTILELLVAFAISSLIVIGCYYLISSITLSNEKLSDTNYENLIYEKLHQILLSDIVSSNEEKFSINNYSGIKEYQLKTHHSIIFQSAFELTVVYQLRDHKLIRKEINESLGVEKTLVLLKNVSNFEILSFNGSEYEDNDLSLKLIKVKLNYQNKHYEFILGKI